MKPTEFIVENSVIAQEADDMHRDHEVQMARSQLYSTAQAAIEIHKLLKNVSEMEGLEGWVQTKIAIASEYLESVRDYLKYEQVSQEPEMMPFAEGAADYALKNLLLDNALSGTGYQQGTSIVKANPNEIQQDIGTSHAIGGTLKNIDTLRQGGPNTFVSTDPAVHNMIRGMKTAQTDVNKKLAIAGVGQTPTAPQQPAAVNPNKFAGVQDLEEKTKNKLRETATGGGSSSGGIATSMAGSGHKKTAGVPKKLGNAHKPKRVEVGKGVY